MQNKRKEKVKFSFSTLFFSTNIVRQHYLGVFLFVTLYACVCDAPIQMGVAKKSFQRSLVRILLSFALNLTLFVAFIRLTLTLLNINFLLHAFVSQFGCATTQEKKRLLKHCIRQKYLASFVSFVVMIIYHCSKPSRTKKNVSQRKNVGNNKVCPVCSLKMCGFKIDYFRFISKFGFQ